MRARVPVNEVDDIVQSALAEALAAERAPDDDDGVVAWVHGIARHKVVDWFRRARREMPHDPQTAETVAAADSAPQSARDLLRWAAKELPNGDDHARTFEWMLREGAGEKLESIAADEDIPAPRVRQRVSRLRKHYRTRWAAALALLMAIGWSSSLRSARGRRRRSRRSPRRRSCRAHRCRRPPLRRRHPKSGPRSFAATPSRSATPDAGEMHRRSRRRLAGRPGGRFGSDGQAQRRAAERALAPVPSVTPRARARAQVEDVAADGPRSQDREAEAEDRVVGFQRRVVDDSK